MFFGTVSVCAPYVAGIIILIFLGWLLAVRSLGEKFNKTSDEEQMTNTEGQAKKPTPAKA